MTTGRSAIPRAPAGLGARGRALWRRLNRQFELDVLEAQLLIELCRSADRCDRIAGELETAPLTVAGSTGQQRPNPLLAALANEAKLMDRLCSSLGISMPGSSGKAGGQRKAALVKAGRAAKSVTHLRGA
jgi:P27 family predicted phage terminase small subunit